MKKPTAVPSNRLHYHLLRSIRLLIWLACASLAQPLAALAQTTTPAPLPPAAQEAVNNGIIAAKVPDYLLAIRYFEEARKLAPQAPVIYLNLGLAESKIPNRELRAIAWFAAYLAADPKASNAASVREQIQILKIKSQSNLSQLIQTLQDSPGKDESRIAAVAELWAKAGDFDSALRVSMKAGEIYGGSAQGPIAAAQMRAGDKAGALKTAAGVIRADYRAKAYIKVAQVQIAAGDPDGARSALLLAREAADKISDLQNRSSGLRDVADIQIKSSDLENARATLAAAFTAASQFVIVPEYKDTSLSVIVQGQSFVADSYINAGDIAVARKSLITAFGNSQQITDPDRRAQGLIYILDYQVKAKDFDNADITLKFYRRTIDAITDPGRKQIFADSLKHNLYTMAKTQVEAGDFSRATKTAEQITDAEYRSSSFMGIAIAQAEAGDIGGAQKTVESITVVVDKNSALSNVRKAQLKARDYLGAIATSNLRTDVSDRPYSVYEVIKIQAKNGDYEGARKNVSLIEGQEYKDRALKMIDSEQSKATAASALATPAPTPAPTPAKVAAPPVWTSTEWIAEIDKLKGPEFLDLGAYLKTFTDDNPRTLFESLSKTASTVASAQNRIFAKLKRK